MAELEACVTRVIVDLIVAVKAGDTQNFVIPDIDIFIRFYARNARPST